MNKVIVVGAGLGGLSTALHLAKQGFSVTVIEKNSMAGGRAQIWRTKGYHFDMGPSWYLLPEVYDEIFADLGEELKLDIRKLPEAYQVMYADNSKIIVPNNPEETIALFESIEKGAGAKLRAYLANSEMAHHIGFEYVVKKPPAISNFLHPKIVFNAFKLKPWKSLHSHVSQYVSNLKLQQMLEYEAVFLGGTPYNIPALYSLVSYWDIVRGVYYPIGGFWSLVQRLETLCKENGVEFMFDSPVSKLVVDDGEITGVQITSKDKKVTKMSAKRVIFNGDYVFAETLLDKKYRQFDFSYWDKADITPSGLCIYLGIKKRIKGLKHHNFYFTEQWKQHADDIVARQWPADPSYYVCAPSKTDSVAPKGCENVFILVPVANDLDDSNKEKRADEIIAHLESLLDEKFADDIEVKRVFCVSDFKKEYNAFKGNAFGLGHTIKHSLVRPPQKSPKVKGLYFVGQYTHPGTGAPMAVLSGKQIAELVKRES